MEITCNRRELLKACQAAKKVINGQSSLPILQNFLLKAGSEGLEVRATNLDTWALIKLDAQGAEPLETTVCAARLLSVLKSAETERVGLRLEAGKLIIAESPTMEFALETLPASEYPGLPLVDLNKPVARVDVQAFKGLSDRCLPFTASDKYDRPALQGITLVLTAGECQATASDSYKLCHETIQTGYIYEEMTGIVPAAALTIIAALIGKQNGELTITRGDNDKKDRLFFSFGQTTISSRLIDGVFPPNWRKIVPTTPSERKALIDKKMLLSCLNRLSGVAKENAGKAVFTFGENLHMVAGNGYENTASAVMPCVWEGEPLQIGFNTEYLRQLATSMPGDTLTLEIPSPDATTIPLKCEAGSRLALLMPMETKRKD